MATSLSGEARHGGSALVVATRPLPQVAVLTLNRPHVHNALNQPLLDALDQAIAAAIADPAVRALVLTGAGRSFCSGDDLKALRDEPASSFAQVIAQLQALTASLLASPKPVIAALNGPAYGAGLELVFACDGRIAADTFVAATPEVRLGLLSTNGASVLLPLLVGQARAREMIFGAEPRDAAWCLDAGLIDEIAAPDALLPRALAIAAQMAKGAPGAVAAARRLLNAPMEAALGNALRLEAELCIAARSTPECAEGVDAHFAGREPDWVAG
jgi:2-(1,2-epoxy-1,2-dihydrophenyl)acetyl-CoA isomerase